MKTFLAIALLSLALNLVSGSEELEVEDRKWLPKKQMRGDDEDADEDEDGPLMDISETRKCYVYGQCQEYSLNFKVTKDPEGCHKFCSKDKECTWWSWEPAHELCMIYANCTEEGVDPPAVEPCPDCISGEAKCPARECHGAFKCQADFVDSFAIATLEECIEKCNEIEDCKWFTLEKANDHCILYEGCNDQFDCETCATGEKKCAHGYKGTTPAPPKVVKVKTVEVKPIQKVTTISRPVQTQTVTVSRPVQVQHIQMATQKRTGEACGPSDTCAGGGRCLHLCCHPGLANPENVALCKPDGWMARCKTGYANYGGGCTLPPKRFGTVCSPGDNCLGRGKCLKRCCHPGLGKSENVAACNEKGWMESCKEGYTNVHGIGCTILKQIGEDCSPGDQCAGRGRCLERCCQPSLAKPQNVAACKPDGWMERCKAGFENVVGVGCDYRWRH